MGEFEVGIERLLVEFPAEYEYRCERSRQITSGLAAGAPDVRDIVIRIGTGPPCVGCSPT